MNRKEHMAFRSMLSTHISSLLAALSKMPSVPTIIYCVIAALINLVLAATIRHLYHVPGYRGVGNMLYLLLWGAGTSIVCSVLVLLCSRRVKWDPYPASLFASDLLISLLPFVLVRCLRVQVAQTRLLAFGAIYAIFLYSKGTLLAWCTIRSTIAWRSAFPTRRWLFTTCLVIFSAMSPWLAFRVSPTGDEPHYLLLTHSLVKDHDFDLSNNYERRDYLAFYPAPLDRHIIRTYRGEDMPIHDIGLSIILIPGYVLAGRLGAMLEMNLFVAAIAVITYTLSLELGAYGRHALLYIYLFLLSAPLSYFGSQLYPELLGGGLALSVVLCFVRYLRRKTGGFLVVSGTLIGVIPWLHVRYWMLAIPLFLVLASFILTDKRGSGDLGNRLRLIAILAAPFASLVVLLSLIDFHLFGILRPNGGYLLFSRFHPDLYPNIHTVFRGLLGLLLDRRVGLLPLTPLYLVALAGLWPLMKRRWEGIAILVPSFVYLLFVASSEYWHGAWAPPARYIVATAVLWTPLASLIPINRCNRDFIQALACWGLVIAATFTADPNFRYFGNPAESNLESFLRSYGFDYASIFPSLVRASQVDDLVAVLWVLIAFTCIFKLRRTASEQQL